MEIVCYGCGRGENPENTIEAIKHCQNVNLDWSIEMDLQLTKDGHVVLFHDDELTRTTGSAGKIYNLNLTEVKKLNSGYNFKVNGEFLYREAPLGIPTLEEVCRLFSRAKLVLDRHTENQDIVDKIIDIVERYNMGELVVIVSKYDYIIHLFKTKRPTWIYGAATKEVKKMVYSSFFFLDNFFSIQSDILMIPVKFGSLTLLTKRVIEHVKKRNRKIVVWLSEGKEVVTVNSVRELNNLSDKNVDGVFTEFPQKLSNELLNKNSS